MLFFSKYEAFLSNSDGDIPEDFLNRFEGEMMGSDRLLSLLTTLGVKPASDVEGFFDSQQSFDDFISIMNDSSLNCYVEFDPSETEAESMTGLFEAEDIDVSLMDDFEVKARIFLTRKEYNIGFFRKLSFYSKFYRSRYHRMYGKFLEFREVDIEAFVESQKSWWKPKDREVNDALRPEELAEKYGKDFSDEELKAFEALNFGMLEDSERRFYEGIAEVEERKKILEESSFDVGKVIEERTFD